MREKKLTGYPSIDKPWLKYYSEEEISAPLPRMTAVQYFEARTEDLHHELAIDAMDGRYTYEEFKNSYRAAAAALYASGIKMGDICLFVVPPTALEAILLYAVNMIGAVLTGLPPQATGNEIIKAAQELPIKKLFIFSRFLTKSTEKSIYLQTNIENIIVYGPWLEWDCDVRTVSYQTFLTLGATKAMPTIAVSPEDLLFIARTGGTTGEPKNVMLNSNAFNIAVHQYINSSLPYERGDCWLRLWPLFSATAMITGSHLPLVAGMKSFVRYPLNDLNEIDKVLISEEYNHTTLIPQILDVLDKSELFKCKNLSYIKTVGCGGLGITSEYETRVANFFARHHINTFLGYGWGCTESGAVAVARISKDTACIGSSGVPLSHTVVAAFDPETQAEKKYGEEGELCISSPTIMIGYYGDETLTKKVIKTHLDGSQWLHTGDLGVVDETGLVTITGRMTRVIFTSMGNKVYPSHLENVIAKVAGVQEVAICKMADPEHAGAFLPVCFLVPDSAYEPEEIQKRVADFCLRTLADYAQPRHIFLRDSLPLTKVGKVDYRALEQKCAEQ